jgi:hypothetical protein
MNSATHGGDGQTFVLKRHDGLAIADRQERHTVALSLGHGTSEGFSRKVGHHLADGLLLLPCQLLRGSEHIALDCQGGSRCQLRPTSNVTHQMFAGQSPIHCEMFA